MIPLHRDGPETSNDERLAAAVEDRGEQPGLGGYHTEDDDDFQ